MINASQQDPPVYLIFPFEVAPKKRAAKPMSAAVRRAFDKLQLELSADPASAQRAYHALVKQYHPDKVATLAPKLRALAEQETKEINEAFRLVRDFLQS